MIRNLNQKMSVNLTSSTGADSAHDPSVGIATEVGMGLGTEERATESVMAGETSSTSMVNKLPPSDLGVFLQRRTLIDRAVLQSSDTYGAIISAYDPWASWKADTFIAAKLRDYYLLRGDLEINVLVTAPPGAYGKYVVFAYPIAPVMAQDGPVIYDPFIECYRQYIYAELDMSSSTGATLVLPWNHAYTHGVIQHTSSQPEPVVSQWKVIVQCLQPIGVGVGSTVPIADINVYCNLKPGFDLIIPFFQGPKSGHQSNTKMSTVANTVAHVANIVGDKVPMLSGFAKPVSAIASTAGTVLSWFGFTRETAQKDPQPVVWRPYSNIANVDNHDTSEIAALSVANTVSINSAITDSSEVDQMSNEYIFSHWSLIGRVPWSVNDIAGHHLKTIPVTPFISEASIDDGAVFTTAGFVGYPFTQWRGDMEYLFMIPVSKFHRGKLQVSFDPEFNTIIADPTNNRYNQIFDIETGSEWSVNVGYVHPRPMLEVYPHIFTPVIVSSEGCNGFLSLTVATQLRSQATSAANTTIFVFARCRNAEFAVLRTLAIFNDENGEVTHGDFALHVGLQGPDGALGDDKTSEKVVEDLVPIPTPLNVTDIMIGEKFSSVRMLMQKFSKIYMNDMADITATRRAFVCHFPPIPHAGADDDFWNEAEANGSNPIMTYYGYYSSMYAGVAGSVRYKFLTAASAARFRYIGVAPVGLEGSSLASFGITGTDQVSPSPLDPGYIPSSYQGVEITVPYYGKYLYEYRYSEQNCAAFNGVDSIRRVNVIQFLPNTKNNTASAANFAMYIAGGPDIRIHRFRGIRKIVKVTVGSGVTTGFFLGFAT